MDDGVAMLFSGGLDTTLEVVERMKLDQRVYLLTFNNGRCINMGGADNRVRALRERYGHDRIHHEIADTGPLMGHLLREWPAIKAEFPSPLVVDLACKMSAVSSLIAFALRNGLTRVTDGAAKEQTQIFLQDPEFNGRIKPEIEKLGVKFVRPVLFDLTRAEKIERLKQEEMASGTPLLEKVHITSQIAHQPFCTRGFVTFFFTSPLRHLGPVQRRSMSVDEAERLWKLWWPKAMAYSESAGTATSAAGVTSDAASPDFLTSTNMG